MKATHIVLLAALVASCNQTGTSDNKSNVLHTTREEHQSDYEITEPIESTIPTLDDHNFASTIKQGRVVVEFYGGWCPSCKAFAPRYERLAARHPGVRFFRMDVDQSPRTTTRYQVAIVPTLYLYSNGIAVSNLAGSYDDDVLDRFVRSTLL